jgi:hypothetical protein
MRLFPADYGLDKPGVLSDIPEFSPTMRELGLCFAEGKGGESVPLIFVTHAPKRIPCVRQSAKLSGCPMLWRLLYDSRGELKQSFYANRYGEAPAPVFRKIWFEYSN